jgi:uncharacterized membrane protein YjjP (DUF1212 family)
MIGRRRQIVLKCCVQITRSALFLRKIYLMEVRKKNKGLYWLLFFISTAALAFAVYSHWPWLTLILPFVTTFFVLAMDII